MTNGSIFKIAPGLNGIHGQANFVSSATSVAIPCPFQTVEHATFTPIGGTAAEAALAFASATPIGANGKIAPGRNGSLNVTRNSGATLNLKFTYEIQGV